VLEEDAVDDLLEIGDLGVVQSADRLQAHAEALALRAALALVEEGGVAGDAETAREPEQGLEGRLGLAGPVAADLGDVNAGGIREGLLVRPFWRRRVTRRSGNAMCATEDGRLPAHSYVRYVQEMLGHVMLEATRIDTRVSIRQLKRIYLASPPAALAEQGRVEEDLEGPDLVDVLDDPRAPSSCYSP
jgi:hypothetical protein